MISYLGLRKFPESPGNLDGTLNPKSPNPKPQKLNPETVNPELSLAFRPCYDSHKLQKDQLKFWGFSCQLSYGDNMLNDLSFHVVPTHKVVSAG